MGRRDRGNPARPKVANSWLTEKGADWAGPDHEAPTVPSGSVDGAFNQGREFHIIGTGPCKKPNPGAGCEEMSDNDKTTKDDRETGVVVKSKPKTKKPSMYKVLLLNDDYTPMEFVVHVLERFFSKSREDATRIMLHVHRRGVGVCGVYTYEVAETKVNQVIDFARRHEHPLQCTLEKE